MNQVEINRKFQREEAKAKEDLLTKHLSIENQELTEIDNRLNQLVDQVLEIDRALKGQEAIQKTQQGLTNHKEIFQQASAYHSKTAWIIVVILLVILGSGGLGLYCFFVKGHNDASFIFMNKDAPTSVLVMILASGLTAKLAFLLIWGAVLKYLSELYKKNAMQAVLYKDRSMALDIVESLLAISPQLEQKKEILRVLSDGYLDFEKSAFHLKPGESNKNEDITIGKLKETVDTIKPLIDSFKGVLDKDKVK